MKYEIQICTIKYSKIKARETRELEGKLLNTCETLYSKMCTTELSQDEEQEYVNAKLLLEDTTSHREQGARVRSRVQEIEYGEESNKFFL